jgi:polysaccharide biosynthesis transport protein
MSPSNTQPSSLGDYFAALRRRFVYPATILPGILFVCILAAYLIHPKYESTATIMLEASSVPKDIIESTVTSYADQQIEIVQGRVMVASSLERIVKEIDPYPARQDWSVADKAQRLLDDTTLERVDPVTFKPQAESNAFSLHYDNPDPKIAEKISSRLAQLFLTYNQVTRTEAASEAAGFLQKQSEQLATQMREVDVQLAAVQSKYGQATPEFLVRNQSIIEDTQRQLDNMQQQILAAQEKESVLSLQLSQTSANLITQSGDLTDLATVRAKLTEAEQRYTPDHPEVKRLKHALEMLMEQNKGGGKEQANNPQYLLTETQLKAARNELAALQAQGGSLREKLERTRGLVAETPVAEKELSDVVRRKEVLQNEYQHVQDRLQSANLAETFESQQGGERFSMVRAPSVPSSPVYPNRVGLILLGFVLGGAIAGIAVAIAESTDTNLRTAKDILLPEGVPVLASIPFILNRTDHRRRAIMLTAFTAAYSLGIAVVIAVLISSRHH